MRNGWWRVFENHNAMSLASVWDWLLQSARPFPCIHNMFSHSLAMNCMRFLLYVYSFSGQQLPSGNQGRGKKPFHLQTRPSIFIQINPSYIPIHRPNGCLSKVRKAPPHHTTALPCSYWSDSQELQFWPYGVFPLAKYLSFMFSIYHPEKKDVN